MKWILLLIPTMAFADLCPKGNLTQCQKYLKSIHSHDSGKDFSDKYDQVCSENKNFQCVKIVVRGDVKDEMKMQAQERGPKASLFPVTLEEEKYIFVFSKK